MHTLSVVRPEFGGAHSARTSIAILYFVFLTACGGGGSGGGGVADDGAPAPGSLDSSFSTDGIVTTTIGTNSNAFALALQSDGMIVVAGNATISGIENFALARYNSDGTLDGSFGTGGTVATAIGTSSSVAFALALQSDGKIVVAGQATNNGIDYFFALARYDSGGTLDATFGTGGIVTTTVGTSSKAFALALQSDGKIVVGGNATILGFENFALARYNSDGTLDTTSFGTLGIVTTTIGASSSAAALGLQTGGQIVVAGTADGHIALVRYDSGGTPDGSFGAGGIVNTAIPGTTGSNAFALGLQTDGKIVVAGNATTNGLAFVFTLVRYNSNGTLDISSFGTSGIITTIIGASSSAAALGLQTDGKIVVAGNSTNGVDFFITLARYTSTGALDTTFGTGGIVTTAIGTIAGASALALQSDGKIVVAGFADGSIALARYNP